MDPGVELSSSGGAAEHHSGYLGLYEPMAGRTEDGQPVYEQKCSRREKLLYR